MATITGSNGRDSLSGTASADSMFGYGGSDTLSGLGGNDTIYGGANSTASGFREESLYGGAGNDSIFGEDGADRIYGGADGDSLYGGADVDTIYGDDGNDLLDAGAGGGSLFGGTGDDTLLGGTGSDTLDGGDGADSLSGGDGADSLTGGNGADRLDGGAGVDTLIGGNDDDTMSGGAGGDYIAGGQGMDYLDYSDSNAAVTVNLATMTASGGHAQGDTISGMDGVFGSAHADSITGFNEYSTSATDAYTNHLYGAGGNDTIDGLAGPDFIFGGDDNDSVMGGAGDDQVSGDAGADQVFGGDGNDTLYGGTGADTLIGGAGADLMYGGADRDLFFGGVGDTIEGGGTGDDFDSLDLTAYGFQGTNIIRDSANPKNGTVEFLDGAGAVIGTLTFSNIENVFACFTPGARVRTARGELPVEQVSPGDMVLTRDDGWQPVRWIGSRTLCLAELVAQPQFLPVRIAAGALGGGLPVCDMVVSPQHRMLIEGAQPEMWFAEDQVLVAATHLVGLPGISRCSPSQAPGVTYLHLLFDRHQLICVDGAWTESYQPAMATVDSFDHAVRAEILALFPTLAMTDGRDYAGVRRTLRAHEARVLMSAWSLDAGGEMRDAPQLQAA